MAYYVAQDGPGVLGPRGWRCFGLYGSNGYILIVTPEAHAEDLFSDNSALKGPAIQLSTSNGDTSGRFEVARVAARLFPTKQAFVRQVIAEGIEPADDFPAGPFPSDRLTYQSPTRVEFETPADATGFGTVSRLTKTGDPIDGFAEMTEDNNLIVLDVRLPAKLRSLASAIIREAERR
ncbi:MAG: hypothetical protein ACREEB_16900 [Caulobacteraceae bacterium]